MRFVIPPGPQGTGFSSIIPQTVAVSFAPVQPATPAAPAADPASDPAYLFQFALSMAAMGARDVAIAALRDVTQTAPSQVAPWRKLAELLCLARQYDEAALAADTADALGEGAPPWPTPQDDRPTAQFAVAEKRLAGVLSQIPAADRMAHLRDLLFERINAVVVMRLLARMERESGDTLTAIALLQRALELAPAYAAARADLVPLLYARHDYAGVLRETDLLLAQTTNITACRSARADAYRELGHLTAALDELDLVRAAAAPDAMLLCAQAQLLHFAGRREASLNAYRECIALNPAMGEAYWGLSQLRGDALSASDIAAMRTHLAGDSLTPASRRFMFYALAHSLERAGDYAASFDAYAQGAALFRQTAGRLHDVAAAAEQVGRRKLVFSATNLAGRRADIAAGPGATPIFIVGLPRSGSTLVEQILASHSQVEATLELPVMDDLARDLVQSRGLTQADFPACLLDLTPRQLGALGESYLQRSAIYRRQGKPLFIDKRLWNWLDIGMITLILPQAKIIDVRRAPMAACFAMFKQILPGHANFSYDLAELGRYYSEYAGLMQHWHNVLPGRVHALSYENLVENTEAEIRALLDYCGLAFEPGCLRFWESDRGVITPSAEQVRRPIFRDGLEQWRHFEPWLGKLADALRLSAAPIA